MSETIHNLREAWAWQRRHGKTAPRPGELAPDFELQSIDDDRHSVRLSRFRGQRPVVLIFGSFS